MPSTDPMLMMRAGASAVPAAWSSGSRNLVVWNTPSTFTSSTRAHDVVSCSASGAPQVAPALLTRMSRESHRSATAAPSPRQPSSVDRSATT